MFVGAHGPNRYWQRRMLPSDWAILDHGKLQALVLLSYQDTEDFAEARRRGLLVICRLANDGGWGTPQQFFERHKAKVRSVSPYCQLFILGNEPNVSLEEWIGSATDWQAWTTETYRLFKGEFPSLQFAPAPISPSGDDPQRWRIAYNACPRGFCAVHAYWQREPREALDWLRLHTGLPYPVHVTEYNRVSGPDIGQYRAFLDGCRRLGVSSASYFIMSGTPDWQRYWLSLNEVAELGREVKMAPQGIGWWIWYLDQAARERPLEQFGRVCKSVGATHLFVKAGDGPNVWRQFARGVDPLKAAGLQVYSWSYCYGESGEAEVALRALEAGADGHVFDVEAECEGKGVQVGAMLKRVREAYPEAWLATAPLPVVDYHDPPLYEATLPYVDAMLPQFYWAVLGPKYGNLDYLFGVWDRWLGVWRDGGYRPVLMPIGQAYGEATPAEIDTFAARCAARGCPAISFWEWVQSTDEQWRTVATLKYQPKAYHDERSLFFEWGLEVLDNNPRDDPYLPGKFVSHLKALGKDWTRPDLYGYPPGYRA